MDDSKAEVLDTLNLMNRAIRRAIELGIIRQALETSRRALDLAEQSFGRDSPSYAVQLQINASVLVEADDRERAAECLQEALELRLRALGEEHPAVATVLYELALIRASDRRLDEALQLLQRSLEIRTKQFGQDHELTTATQRAIDSYQTWAASEQPDWRAVELHNKGLELVQQGHFAEAEKLFLASIDRNLASKGPEHPDVARCQKALGELYVELHDFERAKAVLEAAFNTCERSRASTHELKGMILGNLARVHHGRGDFNTARQFHEDAIREFEALEDSQTILLATAIGNFAGFEYDLGNLDKAEGHYNRALELLEQSQRRESETHRAKIFNGLAILAQDRGDMTKAIRLMENSLQIKSAALGESDLSYVLGADNLAAMYGTIGQSEKAQQWNTYALEVCERIGATDHPAYQKALLTSASIAEDMGETERARETYARIIEMTRANGVHNETSARAMTKMAKLGKTVRGDRKTTESFEEVVEAERVAVGKSHPRYARALVDLATARLESARPEVCSEALEMLREACEIMQRLDNEPPFMRALYLHRLILEEWRSGAASEAQQRLLELAALEDKVLSERVFALGKFAETLGWLTTSTLSLFISSFLDVSDSCITMNDVLNCALTRKGNLFESTIAERRRIIESEYPSVRQAAAEVAREKWSMVEVLMEGPVRSLESLEDQLERSTLRSAEITEEAFKSLSLERLAHTNITTDYLSIVNTLQNGDAILDIIRFDRQPGENFEGHGKWYIAFLVVGGKGVVGHVVLGQADDIDESIIEYLDQYTSRDRKLPQSAAEHSQPLVQLTRDLKELMAPVRNQCDHLFVAPDGVFLRFPFDLLPWTTDDFLIDTLEIVYITSVRDLLGHSKTQFACSRPTVICDPNFDLAATVSDDEVFPNIGPFDANELETNPFAGVTIIYDRVPPDAVDLGFDRLPGTVSEGKDVATLSDAILLTEDDATKERVRRLRSPQILHFATHGFVLESESELQQLWVDRLNSGRVRRLDASMQFLRFMSGRMTDILRRLDVRDEEESSGSEQPWPHLSEAFEDPLLRCGLVLAGANTWLNNDATVTDAGNGILTGREIAYMDLRGTDLVVLSGCRTGANSATTERGVEGLRRAFLLAGASSLIVTLWEIPDQETHELMSELYRRLRDGEPKATALRNAKLWMKERHPEPYFWAGFVFHGDPGPLRDWREINERNKQVR
jgi:CHAT domain-containing protein/TolA-binding protein